MKRSFPFLCEAAVAVIALASCGSKTDLEGRPGIFDGGPHEVSEPREELYNEPPTAVCPEDAYASPTRAIVLKGDGTDDKGVVDFLWEITAAPPGSTALPAPARSPITSFQPDSAGVEASPALFTLELTVKDEEGLSDSCTVTVTSVAGPPIAFCPEDKNVVAGEEVALEGDAYDDGYIQGLFWEIVAGPPGHGSSILEATRATARFKSGADDTGVFTVRFTVTDDEGLTDSCEMRVSVGGIPVAVCPEDSTVPTRTDTWLYGNATDDGTITAWLWECPMYDSGVAPVLGTPAAQDTTFRALKVGRYTMRLTVTDDMGLTGNCTFIITATETPPTAVCPPDIETTPLTEVTLAGNGEDDGTIVSYTWELIDKPAGSSASPPAPAVAQTSYFTPDIAGEYRITLTVTDDSGHDSSCTFTVRATSGEGLRIEMYWNPPEDPTDRSDVDLHALHQDASAWFDTRYDCHYANCDSRYFNLEWDAPGLDDNPRLDLDDVDGYGPENINILEPVMSETYTVGVHYYDNENRGNAFVYVKIYCGRTSTDPIYEVGPKTMLAYGSAQEGNDFWKVARVEWQGFSCAVTPIDQVVSAADAMRHP